MGMPFEEYGTGRCVNCGYLGKRDEDLRISECYPASEYDRSFGKLDTHIISKGSGASVHFKTFPKCFVGKANLREEAAELFDDKDEELNKENVCIHRIITAKRDCPSWYPWREFSSPKEMWEESVMLAMEERREKFELNLFDMSKRLAQNNHKIMVFLGIAAIIFAIVQVIVLLID